MRIGMSNKKELGSIRNTVIGFALIVLCFVSASVCAAPIDAVQDTRQPDTQCINGLWSFGECPSGYEILGAGSFANSLILDSFEYETIPVVRPHFTITPPDGEKWRLTRTNAAGDVRESDPLVTTLTESLFGDRSMLLRSQSGTTAADLWQMFFNNNYSDTSVNDWNYINERFDPAFESNTINRMRVWVKFPAGTVFSSIGEHHSNFQIATYLRETTGNRVQNESTLDHEHYYHYYNIKYEGDTWHQFILDSHPNHRRQSSGNTEHGVISEPFPSIDPGKNYFDVMTYFYLHFLDESIATPADFYIDGIELYEDPYDEDIERIYSLSGVYNASADEIVVAWQRDKNLSNKTTSVKYAFSSFHQNGGYAAHGSNVDACQNVMPFNPQITPNGYNTQQCRATIPNTDGRDYVYIALKHEDSATRFREISIPLTANGYPSIGGN